MSMIYKCGGGGVGSARVLVAVGAGAVGGLLKYTRKI